MSEINSNLEQYRDRLTNSIYVFADYKKQLKESRQAYNQILPKSIVAQASNYSSNNESASKLIHPALSYISKKFLEDITSIPFRYEWASNDDVGAIVVKESEKMLRTLLTQSHITSRNQRLVYHSIVDGLAIIQTTTYINEDMIMERTVGTDDEGNNKVEMKPTVHNRRRVIDMAVYDPINTYLDPNCDGTDISATSDYIIVTLGVFDKQYIDDNFPEYFGGDNKSPSLATAPGSSNQWLDDGEDIILAEESGVNKNNSTREQFKIREYYTGDGYYQVVINDMWMSEKFVVSNGIADRIPFNIKQIITNPDNAMGKSLFSFLRNPIIMASKALNIIADATEMNNSMPMFVFAGSGVEYLTLTEFQKSIIVPVNKVGTTDEMKKMFFRPEIPEITSGSRTLLDAGNQFIQLLAGTNEMAISGQQSPQVKTNGIAEMLREASIRSNNAISMNVEATINGFLWDTLRVFFIYFDDFPFDRDSITRDFFKVFDRVRVATGSSFPEDKLTRMSRAQEVLNLARQFPDGFELVPVFEEYLSAMGANVRFLKSAEENMLQQMSIAIAQNMGEGWQNDKALQKQMQQLAELASKSDVGQVLKEEQNQSI